MTTVLLTIAATLAAMVAASAAYDPDTREALAGVALAPVLLVVDVLGAAIRRWLRAGPRHLGPEIDVTELAHDDVRTTVLVATYRRALFYARDRGPAPAPTKRRPASPINPRWCRPDPTDSDNPTQDTP